MPPIAYALASDTAIGVDPGVDAGPEARAAARPWPTRTTTPLAIVGGVALWGLRLILAARVDTVRFPRMGAGRVPGCPRPPRGSRSHHRRRSRRKSTPARTACRRSRCLTAVAPAADALADPSARRQRARRQRQHRDGSKTSRFLQLVEEQHGPLSAIDPSKVSRISSELAPLVDLHTGSARSVLGKRVRATQNGHSS